MVGLGLGLGLGVGVAVLESREPGKLGAPSGLLAPGSCLRTRGRGLGGVSRVLLEFYEVVRLDIRVRVRSYGSWREMGRLARRPTLAELACIPHVSRRVIIIVVLFSFSSTRPPPARLPQLRHYLFTVRVASE